MERGAGDTVKSDNGGTPNVADWTISTILQILGFRVYNVASRYVRFVPP